MKRRVLAGLVLLASLTACVPASPDADTYDDKAALTVGSTISEVRTVQRLLELLYDDRMLRPTAVAQLRYSEDALDTATKAFTELNQPPSRDRLATRVDTLLGDAGDLLADARIAVERRHRGQYPSLAGDLGRLASTLEQVEGRLS
ncbi:MAG: hypothetical protein ACOYX5_07825 [Actinomycetota bacterium]